MKWYNCNHTYKHGRYEKIKFAYDVQKLSFCHARWPAGWPAKQDSLHTSTIYDTHIWSTKYCSSLIRQGKTPCKTHVKHPHNIPYSRDISHQLFTTLVCTVSSLYTSKSSRRLQRHLCKPLILSADSRTHSHQQCQEQRNPLLAEGLNLHTLLHTAMNTG